MSSKVTDPRHFHLDADRAAGRLLSFKGLTLRQYRAVYVGLDLNGFSSLDTASQTFTADFFLWLRYSGDAAADVVFTNSTDSSFSMGEPLASTEDDDESYAKCRVQGDFNQPLDFHDYPWDVHELPAGFQNRSLDDTDILYVADQTTLSQSQEERLRSGFDLSRPFNNIPNWNATRVWYSQESQSSRSVVQDPATGAPGYVEFSEFQVDVGLERDVRSFLIKNLLPLMLLALVTCRASCHARSRPGGMRARFRRSSALPHSAGVLIFAGRGDTLSSADAIRAYRLLFALATFGAIGYQWIDGSDNPNFSIVNFFSFFTIQSNIIAAAVLVLLATVWREHRTPAVTLIRGAAVAYMTTTGVVYGLLLTDYTEELGTVVPWVNTIVHRIIPLVMVTDWMIERPRFRLEFRRCLIWMAFPVLYFLYSLARGSIVNWYPYPFFDPERSGGYPGVAIYAVAIAVGFVAFVWLVVTLGNRPWTKSPVAHIPA